MWNSSYSDQFSHMSLQWQMYGKRSRKNLNRRFWLYVGMNRRHIWESALQVVGRTKLVAVQMIVFFVLQKVAA